MNSEEEVELFDSGWLPLDEGVPQSRIIVARHRAPAAGKRVSVGKCIGEWVYEIFITTLPAEGFLVEDVFDLYHGRGADRGWCSRMKMLKKTKDTVVFLHRVRTRAVANCLSMGLELAIDTGKSIVNLMVIAEVFLLDSK